MSTIKDRLLAPEVRPQLVHDCCGLIDASVKATKGFSGMAVKGAYSTVKAIKPSFVEGVVDALLDEWMEKLELFEREHTTKGASGKLSAYIVHERTRVAEALVEVTDRRADTTKHKTAAKFYQRLRPSALQHVTEAIPDLAALLDKYDRA
jgi:hypothetical protein